MYYLGALRFIVVIIILFSSLYPHTHCVPRSEYDPTVQNVLAERLGSHSSECFNVVWYNLTDST